MRVVDIIFSLEPEDERHAAFVLNVGPDQALKVLLASCGLTQRPCNGGAGSVDLTETGLAELKRALTELRNQLDQL